MGAGAAGVEEGCEDVLGTKAETGSPREMALAPPSAPPLPGSGHAAAQARGELAAHPGPVVTCKATAGGSWGLGELWMQAWPLGRDSVHVTLGVTRALW